MLTTLSTALFQLLLLLSLRLRFIDTSCPNLCNKKGTCNKWGLCDCFEGYEGYDCSLRSCPSGTPFADIATADDSAHTSALCSGQGSCDYATGTCSCAPGFTGNDCSRRWCHNNCNMRGECLSLRQAAMQNDGYRLNRTTVYTRWDADVIYGCKCDLGWEGFDCSQRSCEYGADPRFPVQANESVTLVCDCSGSSCDGKFKLRYFGESAGSWLFPHSRAYQLADSLMAVPGVGGNTSARRQAPVVAANGSADSPLCAAGAKTKTVIRFRRRGDLPALSFYASLMSNDSLYFETTQRLVCDCSSRRCNGTFALSFDGELSRRLHTWHNASQIQTALQGMATLVAAGVTVGGIEAAPICRSGELLNHSIVFRAPIGNVPRLGLWSSVVAAQPSYLKDNQYLDYYSTNMTSAAGPLYLSTDDGRDDNIKLCNGIGFCNFTTANCQCPHGWGFDADIGPCARLQMNTSDFPGLQRCPGTVEYDGSAQGYNGANDGRADLQLKQNHDTIIYISLNPAFNDLKYDSSVNHSTISTIESFTWSSTGVYLDAQESTRALLVNLTSNTSAGPLFLDGARQRIFFADLGPSPFIGYAPTALQHNYTVWLRVDYVLFGLTADARFNQRKLYWTRPGSYGRNDGNIYWADMDDDAPTAYALGAAIGSSNRVIDPMGIALHPYQERVYWMDRNATSRRSSLRSANLDGSGYREVFVYKLVGNMTVSVNATDLVIDLQHNNTAFFLDVGGSVVATNLDFPTNLTSAYEGAEYEQEYGFYASHIVTSIHAETMGSPRYVTIDDLKNVLVWSDPSLRSVRYKYYDEKMFEDFQEHADRSTDAVKFTAYQGVGSSVLDTSIPVGLTLDRGLGPPRFVHKECYGNGRCTGFSGKFVCECYDGFYGDCQARSCPRGPAWFHEPAVDEIAHDEFVECSNMGLCDRASGRCACRPGFEGNACQRSSCSAAGARNNPCSGAGGCMSLRRAALKRNNALLEPDAALYGSSPMDPATWDADMAQVCVPYEYGYINDEYGLHNITSGTGYYLSDYDCPWGYNSRYADDAVVSRSLANHTAAHEVQRLICRGEGGYFTLSFRGDTSSAIYANGTTRQLQLALQSLPRLGKVRVEWLNDFADSFNASLCRNAPLLITFISELGAVPLLALQKSSMSGFSQVRVSREQPAAGVLEECSGHGVCDRSRGLCRCHERWGSGDGTGAVGERGDCGHSLVL